MLTKPARWRLVLPALAFGGAFGAAAAKADGGIAVVAPMSGPYATTGAAMREAAEARLAGTAPAIIEDDGCQADKAVEAAGRVVAAKPAVVIGHPCSSAAIAAAPIYAAAQIPFISTGARHADLTDKRAGPLVFRLSGRDDRQGKEAAAFLSRTSGGRAIAILQDRTFAMSTIAGDAATALTRPAGAAGVGPAPGPKVMQFPFVASELNYEALVAKVIAFAGKPENVGAVFFAGFPAEAIVVLRTLRLSGVTAPFLGVDALATGEFGALVTAELGDVRVLLASDKTQSAGDSTFAAIGAWQSATRDTAANPGTALANIAYDDPALGRITFDAKGDAAFPSYMVSAWREGAWTPVSASEAEKIPPP